MKKIFNFLMATAIVFGLASCSKDIIVDEGGLPTTDAVLSFSFNKPQGALQTRADIATPNEWYIATLDMYAFDKNTGAPIAVTTGDYTKVDGTRAYTITMKPDWVTANLGKDINFYFVGNNTTSTQGAHAALVSAPNEMAFKNALTNELTLNGAKANLIHAVNGSTQNLLFSAVIEDVRLSGKVQKSGTLKRREARFDIVNTINASFVVNKIYVTNASRNGFIFPTANAASPAITKASHVDIAGPSSYDVDGLAASVFYLYPTQLGDTETTIVIEATAGSVTSLYQVKSEIEILANTRYKIVLDPATLTFNLVVADYEEGNELPVEEATAPGLIGFSTLNGAGILTSSSYQLVADETSTITATLGALSSAGFDVTVSGATVPGLDATTIAGNMTVGAINTTRAVSNVYYPVTVDFEPLYTTAIAAAGTEVLVTFTDKANSKNQATVLFYDPTSTRTAEAASNAYMVKPGSAVIEIPLSRVYEYWTSLPTNTVFHPQFVWTDNANGMRADGSVAGAYVKGSGNNAVLYIQPGSAEGNTVVAVTDDAGDIKWSWHIWTTAYNPGKDSFSIPANSTSMAGNTPVAVEGGMVYRYNATVLSGAGIVAGTRDNVFMDRNLGSVNVSLNGDMSINIDTEASQYATYGLFYQFGRKDPFSRMAGATVNTPSKTYDQNGNVITAVSEIVSVSNNLENSIANPSTYYLGIVENDLTGLDWYTNVNTRAAQNDALWGSSSILNDVVGSKSLYDPCPLGWRIPISGRNTVDPVQLDSPWFLGKSSSTPSTYGATGGTTSNGYYFTDNADFQMGFYPMSGLVSGENGEMIYAGVRGYIATATPNDTKSQNVTVCYIANGGFNSVNNTQRAHGVGVRCVKE